MQSMIKSIVVRLREVLCITCYVHAQQSNIKGIEGSHIASRVTIFTLSHQINKFSSKSRNYFYLTPRG